MKRLHNTKKLDINIHEGMFNLIEESVLFISGLNLQIRILSETFNVVLSVMWRTLKFSIFI